MAPRLDRDDDGERDDDEREQEVRHHRERVQVEDHGQAAERDLRDGAEKRAERRASNPARQAVDAARGEPGHERGQDPDERDDAVAELDHRVEVLRRERRIAAARPVVAAEPRPRQADERARGDDEPERRDRADRDPEEAVAARPAREGAARTLTRLRSDTPLPASTRPTACSVEPGAGERRLEDGALLRGKRDEQPARRLRVVGERLELGAAPSSRRAAPANSRFRRSPPVRTPAAASSSAPGERRRASSRRGRCGPRSAPRSRGRARAGRTP